MRARVVLYNPKLDSILLIHRHKAGRDYWVIPGGGAKQSETPRQTAIREINEELMIKLVPQELHKLLVVNSEFIFLAQIKQTFAPEISGEEKQRATNDNVYQPAWVLQSDLTKINLMPPDIGEKIQSAIKQ